MPETRTIAVNDIAVEKRRLRALREETVNALVQSMVDQGQLQSIVVRPNKDGGYWLVAGLHRLEAAKNLRWKEINCTIFDGMAADKAELAEIDENLIRAELSPAERAVQIGKRKELYEKVHPETKKGGAPGKAGGGKKSKTAKLATFARDTATKTGVSRRSVERDATRAKRVVVLGEIVDTPLDKGAEIDALAKLSESEQRVLAEAAKRGERVSAISARKACDAEAGKIAADIGNRHEDPGGSAPGDMPVNSVPFSVQIAAIMARVPAFAVGPEQIAARKAALLREENEIIARHAAQQRDWQVREARAAQEELKRKIEGRRAGGR